MKIRENREKLKIENQPKLKIWGKLMENWNLGKNKNWEKKWKSGKNEKLKIENWEKSKIIEKIENRKN